jgi:hypothetical protein
MGAEPWTCFAPYQEDVAEALEEAKRRVFAAGRYRMPDPDDPPGSIDEARLQAAESGTGSILDMIGVTDTPHDPDAYDAFCMIAPLSREQLFRLYGTDKPTRAMVKANYDLFEEIDRGLGVYVVVYEGDTPSELFFAGYSFD